MAVLSSNLPALPAHASVVVRSQTSTADGLTVNLAFVGLTTAEARLVREGWAVITRENPEAFASNGASAFSLGRTNVIKITREPGEEPVLVKVGEWLGVATTRKRTTHKQRAYTLAHNTHPYSLPQANTPAGVIIGSAFGGISLFLVLAVLVCWCMRRQVSGGTYSSSSQSRSKSQRGKKVTLNYKRAATTNKDLNSSTSR